VAAKKPVVLPKKTANGVVKKPNGVIAKKPIQMTTQPKTQSPATKKDQGKQHQKEDEEEASDEVDSDEENDSSDNSDGSDSESDKESEAEEQEEEPVYTPRKDPNGKPIVKKEAPSLVPLPEPASVPVTSSAQVSTRQSHSATGGIKPDTDPHTHNSAPSTATAAEAEPSWGRVTKKNLANPFSKLVIQPAVTSTVGQIKKPSSEITEPIPEPKAEPVSEPPPTKDGTKNININEILIIVVEPPVDTSKPTWFQQPKASVQNDMFKPNLGFGRKREPWKDKPY
jgi:hypothetical protein